jgi:hypothetical protein
VRASAGQGLGIRSERAWALVRLNATTSPYHSFDRGRDAPHASRRTPDTQVQYPILHVHPKPSLWQTAGRARPRLFQLALCVRLGVPLAELGVDGEVVVCKGYGAGHDRYGRHPSSCTKGNRSSLCLDADRHDGLQRALMRATWFARVAARAVGAHDYFGSANLPLKKLRAEIVCMHYYGMGRHLFRMGEGFLSNLSVFSLKLVFKAYLSGTQYVF